MRRAVGRTEGELWLQLELIGCPTPLSYFQAPAQDPIHFQQVVAGFPSVAPSVFNNELMDFDHEMMRLETKSALHVDPPIYPRLNY